MLKLKWGPEKLAACTEHYLQKGTVDIGFNLQVCIESSIRKHHTNTILQGNGEKEQYLFSLSYELLGSIKMTKCHMAKAKYSEAVCTAGSAFLVTGNIKHRPLNQIRSGLVVLCMEMLSATVQNYKCQLQ